MKNMFKRLLSIAIVAVMVIGMIPGTAFYAFAAEEGANTALTGTGTEADPFMINTLADLVTFRDSVNANEKTYNAEGTYVALGADIDMASIDWSVNIGDDCNYTFDGIFDGKGHTIKNLNGTETAQKGDGFVCTGLFGSTGGSAVVKNLTIENVTMNTGDFTGSNAAAVVGFSYNTNGSVENVKVIGDIQINAKNIDTTGVIVGYDYYGKLTIKDCVVKGNAGSFVTGQAYVGGVIGYASTNSKLINNTVENIAVTATACCAGGVAGLQLYTGVATGNTVKNVQLDSQHANWKNAVGVVVGCVSGPTLPTVTGTTFENVTVAGNTITNVLGSEHKNKPTEPVKSYVAAIDGKGYTSLEEALEAATAGQTITLIADIAVATPITIAAGKEITLDLNGQTLSGTDTTTKSYALITNRGTLTIEDSVGGGKITLAATTDTGFDRYSSVISNTVGGKLTVKGGTLEHLGGTSMAYAIDNLTNGKGTYAETVIEGGTVKSTYRAIRQFLNGIEAQNILTVTGGTIEGANKSIWMQDPSANANTGKLTVGKGATLNGDVYLYVTPGSTTWPVEVSIAAEALSSDSEVLTGNVPEGLSVVNKGGNYGVFEMPTLPTATVSAVVNKDLTFATNFKADEVTDAQLAYYGDWYADFVLTFPTDVTLNANGGADGYLSGQYDSWSENWVNVPLEDVSLKGGESLKVMEYAAKLMGKPGLKLTYNDVYTAVKDFDCGVFLEDAYIKAHAGEIITLELRMYNPENEAESYLIGKSYEFMIPVALPTATVSEVVNEDLTFATNFKADEVTAAQLAYYGDWYADFVLTFPTDVTLNANGGADGFLSGQYDSWSENWVNVPFENVSLKGGEGLKVMEYAAKLMGKPGLKLTYNDVYTAVKDFDCGVFLEDSYISANAGKKILLELRMYNPENEAESYVIGETYEFIIPDVDAVYKNTTTGKTYDNSSDATMEAKAGETVILLKDHTEGNVLVSEGVDLDLNGYTLTATYASVFGNLVDNSEANSGALVVEATKFLIQTNNKQLTVKTAKGYQFVEIIGFNQTWMNETTFVFQPLFESAAHDMLNEGVAVTGVSIQVVVTWKPAEDSDDRDTRTFKYGDTLVTDFINSYKPATGKYGRMFTLTLVNPDNYLDLTCNIQVASDTGVTCAP